MNSVGGGGCAFPVGKEWSAKGMSLRDYFAGQALAGLVSRDNYGATPSEWAVEAYKMADAMLIVKARS